MSLTSAARTGEDATAAPPFSAEPDDERTCRLLAMHQRVIFDRASDSLLIITPERTVADANRHALAMLGYARGDALGLPVSQIFPSAPPWAHVQHDGIWEGLAEIRAEDGVVRLVEIRAEAPLGASGGFSLTILRDLGPIQQPSEPLTRLVALVAAPTEPIATAAHSSGSLPGELERSAAVVQENAERGTDASALADSGALFATAFADAPVGMAVVRQDGTIVHVNRAICEMLGYTEEELLATPFTRITHPADVEASTGLLHRIIAGEGERQAFEKRDVRKDGQIIWTLLSVSPAQDSGGPRHFVAQMQDITERKAAESELLATHQDRREILQHITDGFFALDREWRFTYLNPTAEEQFGRTRHEMLGVSFWQAFPLLIETPLHAALHRAMVEGMPADVDVHLASMDLWFDVRAYPTPNGIVVYFRDVTEGKTLERELRGALASAHAANRASSDFLAMMSHELRTPMQAVLGYADLLLAGPAGSLSSEQADDVRCIQQGAKRIIALVDQMLDLSRLQAGRLEITMRPVDLADVVEQVRQDVAPQAAAKSLKLAIDIPGTIPPVRADATRLRQILLNLIGNAVKFTDAGSVRVCARETDAGIEIAVQDTGIGIPEEALGHIFEEFRQADSRTTRRYGGAGLGLAIARNLAEQHGGAISVKSIPGVGSTFTLTMPFDRGR